MHAPWAFLNGKWISRDALCLDVDDVGFSLGVTVTERLRTFGQRVFRLDEHLARMRRSLEIVGLDSGEIARQFEQAIPEFVRRNESHIAANDDWSIAAFATPGHSAGQPTVCVHGNVLPFVRWAAQYDNGVSVVVSDVRQVPENCWPSELKCRSRMHYYLADLQAATLQPGARAILLDQEGFVAEATTANVVVYRAGEGLVSPSADHILVGVSLGVIRELAAKLNVPFIMRRLTVDELRTADEAMLASTSVCVLPITTCNGQPIASGQPGAIFKKLLTAWNALVGLDVAAQARALASR